MNLERNNFTGVFWENSNGIPGEILAVPNCILLSWKTTGKLVKNCSVLMKSWKSTGLQTIILENLSGRLQLTVLENQEVF